MLFVDASEPSSYVFPLVLHAAASDLPGGKTYSQEEAIMYRENLEEKIESSAEPPTKRVRGSPNVSKYINDIITATSERLAAASAPLHPALTAGLSSHSLRRGSAANANASPQLAIQWISTRGAWLLDSLTKAFAYVDTTTREDQSVVKVLAGFKAHLPCTTPTVTTLKELLPGLEYAQLLTLRGQLFKNVSGFTDTTLNADAAVLDSALASLRIYLDEVVAAVHQDQATNGFTSHYLYRFHEALDSTNAAVGSRLSLDKCIAWGHQLCTSWETENLAQLGECSGGDMAVLAAAITEMLSSIATMQRSLHKLVAIQEDKSLSNASPVTCKCATTDSVAQSSRDVVVEAHSLAGCFYNWYTLELGHTATQKEQQFIRTDRKARVNTMIIAAGRGVDVPSAPLDRNDATYRLWKQAVWTLAEDLDSKTHAALGNIDEKGRSRTAGSLRKRWRKLRADHRPAYDALCTALQRQRCNRRSLHTRQPPMEAKRLGFVEHAACIYA